MLTQERQLLVKVQVPLSTNDPNPQALVYDEGRTVEFFAPITRDVTKRLNGAPKGYFYANVKGIGKHAQLVKINAKASFQSW